MVAARLDASLGALTLACRCTHALTWVDMGLGRHDRYKLV